MTKASCARTALGVLLLSASINAQQELKILAIVNAASYEAGVPRGGALASIFCTGLLDINGTILPQPSSPLPSSLHDVQVRINGGTAPILSISQMDSYEQINIQVPIERDGSTVPVRVDVSQTTQGGRAGSLTADYPPLTGFFTNADGYVLAEHSSDSSQITKANPAHPGETVTIYGTGLFPTWPPPPIAFPVPMVPVFPTSTSDIQPFGNANLVSITLAPGTIGLQRVTLSIPHDATAGDFPIGLSAPCNNIDLKCLSSGRTWTTQQALLPVK